MTPLGKIRVKLVLYKLAQYIVLKFMINNAEYIANDKLL